MPTDRVDANVPLRLEYDGRFAHDAAHRNVGRFGRDGVGERRGKAQADGFIGVMFQESSVLVMRLPSMFWWESSS